jgi:D-threo-aldose 1-dehydrogenase
MVEHRIMAPDRPNDTHRKPTPLTLGVSALGRDTEPGSREEAAAVEVAIDLLRSEHAYVDTSNNYAGGRSESVLGIAISHLGADAGSRIISKVDCDPHTGVFDRDRVLRSFEETTSRLGVDRIPLLHLHDPYTVSFEEAIGPGGALEGMIELRDSGQVGAIGIAAGPVPLVERYVATRQFDAVLVHNRFTLVDQSAGSLFEEAHRRGMTVFNAAPFGAGILATGPQKDAMYHYGPADERLQEWVSRVDSLCGRYGVPLIAVALHFSLRSPFIDSTVVGVARPGRREQLDDLAHVQVPDALWDDLDAIGPAPSPIDDHAND